MHINFAGNPAIEWKVLRAPNARQNDHPARRVFIYNLAASMPPNDKPTIMKGFVVSIWSDSLYE